MTERHSQGARATPAHRLTPGRLASSSQTAVLRSRAYYHARHDALVRTCTRTRTLMQPAPLSNALSPPVPSPDSPLAAVALATAAAAAIAMPLLTPSRLAIVVVFSFSVITFFWTFALPIQSAQPEVPVIDHYNYKNVHTEPIIPAPAIETPHPTVHGHGPGGDDKEEAGGVGTAHGGAVPSTLLTHAANAANAANPTPTPAAFPPASTHAVEHFCKNLTLAHDVMVVLQTSKVYMHMLDAHMQAFMSCVPTFVIFSDHDGEFHGHKVHDALKLVSHDVRFSHDEFQEYRILRADAAHTPNAEKLLALDKWKMLPMVYRAYHMKPDAKFIIFLEDQTALSWTNLLQWLRRLDYRIPYYSGAPVYISGTQSVQRGPGIMLSQGALRRFAKSYDELYTSKWEKAVDKECCGDLMLARALADAHVELYSSWPILQTERPNTLDYTQKHWCTPAVSWYQVDGQQITQQWEIEKKWTSANGWNTPYLYRDAFHDHVAPHMEETKEGWDNLSQDAEIVAPTGRQKHLKDEADKMKLQEEERKKQEANKEEKDRKEQDAPAQSMQEANKDRILQVAGQEETQYQKRADKDKDKTKQPPNWDKFAEKYPNAADSLATCQKTCKQVEDCLQWRYSTEGDGHCYLSKVIRLGGKDGDGKWTSGWVVDRIETVQKEWKCEKAEWNFYQ